MSDGIKTIYNEGRTVGLSAYELYVRKLYENDPSVTPPTEKAWLASMFGNGNAMILKINSGTQAGVQDFALPSGSILCGSNTLFASVFNGDCKWSDTTATSDTGAVGYWAEAVTSYGGLIKNTSESYPTSSDIPYSNSIFDNAADRQNAINYCRIAEGIVIQQGTWVAGADNNPYKDLTDPAFGSSPAVIRLYITQPLTSDVKLIITGFLDSEFASTLAGLDGSTNPLTNGASNGEFLGPSIFPWSSKIIMIYPNLANIYNEEYARILPQGTLDSTTIGSYSFAGQTSDIEVSSVIDLNTTDPNTYYQVNSTKYGSSVIPMKVTSAETAKDQFNVLAVMEPGMTVDKANAAHASANPNAKFFPPALYTSKVDQSGVQNMVPVDTAAPGTVKMFDNTTEASNYPKQVPNTYAFCYNPNTNNLSLYNANGSVGDLLTKLSVEKVASGNTNAVRGVITAQGNTLKLVSLSDDHGNLYPITGSSGTKTISTANVGFSWADLLDALANNKKIDVLGSVLKAFRDNLPNITITGDIQAANGKFTTSVASRTVKVGNPTTTANASLTYNSGKGRIVCDNEIQDSSGLTMGEYVPRCVVTGTLTAGQTSITLTDAMFTNTSKSCYKIFTSKWGVNPTAITPGNGTVTITFRAQSQNITVGAMCFDAITRQAIS